MFAIHMLPWNGEQEKKRRMKKRTRRVIQGGCGEEYDGANALSHATHALPDQKEKAGGVHMVQTTTNDQHRAISGLDLLCESTLLATNSFLLDGKQSCLAGSRAYRSDGLMHVIPTFGRIVGVAKSRWSVEDDLKLARLVKRYGGKHWALIADHFPGKTGTQCSQHWRKCADPTLIKNQRWTKEEDDLLLELKTSSKDMSYQEIAKVLKGRTNIQIRNRWDNALNPAIRRGPFNPEEDRAIYLLRSKGWGWTKMSDHGILAGRAAVALKNRYRHLSSRVWSGSRNKMRNYMPLGAL